MGQSEQPDADDQKDFVLHRKPSDFRRPLIKGHSVQTACCCCCCCLDILGAYVGAYLGGAIGSGVAYRRLRKASPRALKYRWPLLTGLLATAIIAADLFVRYGIDPDWLPAQNLPAAVIAVSLGIWVFGINPALCFLMARRFSVRLLLISVAASVAGMLIGFGIGCAIMSGSIILGDL